MAELSKYFKLRSRQNRNRIMLRALQDRAHTGVPGAQVITGMPHASGVSDQVSNLVIEIEDLKERISHLESRCAEEKKRLEKYIGAIKDDQTRMIFRLRFLHCMTWPQVAEAIGGRNTANSVKLICHRYLNPKS